MILQNFGRRRRSIWRSSLDGWGRRNPTLARAINLGANVLVGVNYFTPLPPVSLFACSCWLSLEGGLLYAFVGPAAAVVLVRFKQQKCPKNAHLRCLLHYWHPYILLKAQ